jgi:hypothetical protein
MATKYDFPDVREQLIHSLKDAYPTELGAYQTANVLGEDIFGAPKPHPNSVLNLFLEQSIGFAIPVAAYRASLCGLSSLLNNKPSVSLPRFPLASSIHGSGVIRSEISRFAHSIVRDMSLKECRDGKCTANSVVNAPARKMKTLNKVYDVMIKGGKGDVLTSISLGDIVCVNCAKAPEQVYRLLCQSIWENLPRIFGVGKSWDEVWLKTYPGRMNR